MVITDLSICNFVSETQVHQQNNQFFSPPVCLANCYSISVSHLASARGQNQSLSPLLPPIHPPNP